VALQTFTAGQVLTAAQVNALQTNDFNQTVDTKVANYTLVAGDAGKRIVGNGTSITFTVNNTVFNAGDTIKLHNINSTALTVAAGAGVTINAAAGLTMVQYQEATLFATSASSFILFESTAATTTQGLTLINTTSFSAVASQSINDVFSSTYTNYRIYINAKSSVGETDGRLRLRVSGADASGVNYVYANSSLGANGTSYNQTSGGNSFIVLGRIGANGDGQIVTDISKPNEATRTTTASYIACDGTTTFFNGISAGVYALTTVFTGFTFIAESGTMTGSVSVYGYNK
jgi:hypothetical protein